MKEDLEKGYIYNPRFFNGKNLISGAKKDKPSLLSINHIVCDNGLIIGIFQGNRGENPELDFVVKFLSPGIKSRLRTPSHTHWIVDILMKNETNPEITKKFITFFKNRYDKVEPFNSLEERSNFTPETPRFVEKEFGCLEHRGIYSLECLAIMIELFTKCEKRTKNAFMFKNLLQLIVDYCEGKKDYYQVIALSKRV